MGSETYQNLILHDVGASTQFNFEEQIVNFFIN
jgi:hypothetical protein